jgi:hypothetical protein
VYVGVHGNPTEYKKRPKPVFPSHAAVAWLMTAARLLATHNVLDLPTIANASSFGRELSFGMTASDFLRLYEGTATAEQNNHTAQKFYLGLAKERFRKGAHKS